MNTEVLDGKPRYYLDIGDKKKSKGVEVCNVDEELASLKQHVRVNKRRLSD
jgi:hypothetical protein